MPKPQNVDFGPFLGLNEDDNLLTLRDGELQVANNVFHQGNILHTRPGLVTDPDGEFTLAGIPAPTKPIEGAFEFRKEFGASRTLMIIHNNRVYTDFTGPTALTQGSVTMTTTAAGGTGSPWVMAQHRNVVVGAGGVAADDAWFINDPSAGGTLLQLAMVDSQPVSVTPKLVFEKWNYLFAAQFYDINTANVSTDSNANALVVRYSDLGAVDPTDAATMLTSWPASNAIGGPGIGGISGDFGNWITGFGEYQDNRGDWLIVGTRRRMYAVQQGILLDRPFQITDSIPNGLVHQRAFVSLGLDSGDAIYMSDKGIHSLRQSQQFGQRANTFLSWPIRKTFAGLDKTKLHLATGAYWPKEGLVVFAAPATGNSGKVTQMMAMDIKNLGQNALGQANDITAQNVRWYLWQLSTTTEGPSMVFSARDTNDEWFIYGGTYTGDVGQFQTTSYLDLGASYRMQWRANDRHFGVWGKEKQLHDVFVKALPTGSYTPQITASFDFDRNRSARDFDLALESQSTWDADFWPAAKKGPSNLTEPLWADEQTMKRVLVNFDGSGESIAMEVSHKPGSTASEPVGVCQITAQVSGLGDDLGDATSET